MSGEFPDSGREEEQPQTDGEDDLAAMRQIGEDLTRSLAAGLDIEGRLRQIMGDEYVPPDPNSTEPA